MPTLGTRGGGSARGFGFGGKSAFAASYLIVAGGGAAAQGGGGAGGVLSGTTTLAPGTATHAIPSWTIQLPMLTGVNSPVS